MKLKSAEDITPEFLQTAEASAEVRNFISERLNEVTSGFAEKVSTAEKEKKDSEEALALNIKALAEIQDKLATLEKQVEAKKVQETFDARMDEVVSAFELDEKQKTAVASQIKGLDEDGFTSWKSNFELFAAKKSEAKASEGKDEEKEERALETATASKGSTPPNSLAPEKNELAELVKNLSKAIKFN